MSLADWLNNGLLVEHQTNPQEIKELLGIADRDMVDCLTKGLSPDSRLSIAYNAALQVANAALAASGYRATREAHHYRIIQSLTYTIAADSKLVARFNRFRKKRNVSDYERAGAVSDQEAREMFTMAQDLRTTVEKWLRRYHPELMQE